MKAYIKRITEKHLSNPQLLILFGIITVISLTMFFLGQYLTPFFASIVIAYLLEGLVLKIGALGIPRKAGVYIVFLLFLASLVIIIFALSPLIYRQLVQLFRDLPDMISSGQDLLLRLPEKYPVIFTGEQIENLISKITSELTGLTQYIVRHSVSSIKSVVTLVIYLILVPFMVFFFLKDKKEITDWFKQFLPKDILLTQDVWNEVNDQIANYIRGKIWQILIVWSASLIVFKIIGLKYAMLISLMVGISVLIPYVGVTVMFIPVILVGYFQWGIMAPKFYYAIISCCVIHVIDGNIIVPLLLAEVVDLHPIAIIVSILIFGGLFGFWGLFFAIPLATLIHSIIKAWKRVYSEIR